jgi:hypothetical protein
LARAEVEAKLRKAAIKTLRSAELKKQFETQDALPSPSTPEESTAFVKGERAKWELVPSVSSSTEVAVGCSKAVEQGRVRQHREKTTCELRY